MRLIDADMLKKPVEVAVKESWFYKPMYQSFLKAIDNAPTIDAEPVRHGHWIKMADSDGDYYCCSNCGEELPRYSCVFPTLTNPFPVMKSIEKTNRCPNCGAKMDGDICEKKN